MSKNNRQTSGGKGLLGFLSANSVPVMFVLICAVCIPISGFSPAYLLNEIVTRMGRNVFLILSLLIPIMAGMGLNFGMTLGAMAVEIEMVTSYIISYFINGVYQLVVLYMMGAIIPISHSSIRLPRGYGIRNTVSLLSMRQSLDNALALRVAGVKIPVLTFIIIALMCLVIVWFRRTKLGQDMRAVVTAAALVETEDAKTASSSSP